LTRCKRIDGPERTAPAAPPPYENRHTPEILKDTRERAQSFLKPEHQQRILTAYKTFADVPGFAKVATLAEIGANAGNLSIPLYVKPIAAAIATDSNGNAVSLRSAWDQWQTDGRAFWQQMDALVETLDGLIAEDIERV
jgi:type I restriction enzyme M protein